MKLEPTLNDRHTFLCPTFHVTEVQDMADLLTAWRDFKAKNSAHSLLLTLDDFGQACYTSMHSIGYHNLDDTEGHDLSHLPASCFENGEHVGYFTTPEELPIMAANFEKGVAGVTMEDVAARGVSLFGEETDADEVFADSCENLLPAMELPRWVFQVPWPHGYQTLFAFPNGYFSSDLNPFENYVLAKHLEEQYGYALIGIGASRLAFVKTRPMDEPATTALIATLQKIYRDDFHAKRLAMLSHCIRNFDVLMLRYTE